MLHMRGQVSVGLFAVTS